ncbi:MAG: hypothetical protein E6K72_08340 [Candidatus Eisenbacteria bacterium]|uniref:Protein kinase domain-containing protein n=1 Tax=Eiseniibacteriota bacterium TaxID=2212470 RepID=A0A538SQ79_UNCEI|nr:MAG: hypothetical protein E6K72_08340 [Candidatus Eisenbacteria bacterium]
MSSAPGPTTTISHYRLLQPLGRGAMGEVWLAEDTQLPRQVAVKLLPSTLTQDPEAVDRLLREAQAAASVDHPAVVTVYEAGLDAGRPYLVMQRAEGETLEERLARGPLPIADAIDLAVKIADALAEVHALGIVHRDLKPANVILTARGPKVLDFGVASLRGSPRLTATGIAVGTPYAMSPEQMKGLPPDNRSDLWALGVMLYQALTGKRPFEGASFEAVMHAVLNTQPPPPSALGSGIGPDLDFIVMKLLRKDAAHRYARAEELIADLTSCEACRAEPGASSRALREAPRPPRLAVLPFEVMSADSDDAYLAAGLAEDLIVDLTRLGGLTVASRAEVAPYRDRAVPPRTLARELAADYVLLGSVRRAGNRARISTQLVRASDGHALWADRFDRTLEDLFDVQAEVSKRIVEALHLALKPGEREMLDRAPTRSAEAYRFYLRAREIMEVAARRACAPRSCSSRRSSWIRISRWAWRRWARSTPGAPCAGGRGARSQTRRCPWRSERSSSSRTCSRRCSCARWSTGCMEKWCSSWLCSSASRPWIPTTRRRWSGQLGPTSAWASPSGRSRCWSGTWRGTPSARRPSRGWSNATTSWVGRRIPNGSAASRSRSCWRSCASTRTTCTTARCWPRG